jgi:glyoxylase-like metal-dependent hydrolase (beta-lactamase superfamily II)
MIEEISEDLYRIELVLPRNYPKSVNAYVVRDAERSLVIDAGLQVDKCVEAMQAAMKKLGVNAAKADLFLTHCHGDHIGFAARLIKAGSAVYINRLEANYIREVESGALTRAFRALYQMSGIPEGNVEEMLFYLVRDDLKSGGTLPFQFVTGGDILKRGKYQFTCVETPGHSKGHMCLYEPDKKLFISGDHLLEDAGPVIPGRFDNDNPLKDYLSSLFALDGLDIELVLPGHGRPFRNSKQRIRETIEHHHLENLNILSVLREGRKTPYEISSHIMRTRSKGSTKRLSTLQVFVFVAGTLGRLRYLEEEGKIRKAVEDKVAIYSLEKEEQRGQFLTKDTEGSDDILQGL